MKIMRPDSAIFRWIGAPHVATIGSAMTLQRCRPTALSMEEPTMWTKPEFTEMRFGFEVTMYIYNR